MMVSWARESQWGVNKWQRTDLRGIEKGELTGLGWCLGVSSRAEDQRWHSGFWFARLFPRWKQVWRAGGWV